MHASIPQHARARTRVRRCGSAGQSSAGVLVFESQRESGPFTSMHDGWLQKRKLPEKKIVHIPASLHQQLAECIARSERLTIVRGMLRHTRGMQLVSTRIRRAYTAGTGARQLGKYFRA